MQRNIQSEPLAAAEAAAALLDLAMEESQAPVDQLGDALARISRALAGCMRLSERQLAELGAAQASGAGYTCRDQLRREIAVCIENLQFHDRLMQQLTHVRECLAGLRQTPPPEGSHDLAKAWNQRHAAEGSIELF